GLQAGIRFVRDVGIEAIAERECRLYRMLRDGLYEFPGVTLYAPEAEGSVLSFSVQGRPSEEIADVLDESNICVRAGFHCAALAHKTLGTSQDSGAVRVGFGYFNTADEVHRMLSAVRRILRV
ncbi:MAG: aminotransferase class V-fold PLP-dependent enzyme, partial [Clostridia bacterium]|nr:aminotransferase class V-fold PLP-dependent enzyme [Clostridia bacterium]